MDAEERARECPASLGRPAYAAVPLVAMEGIATPAEAAIHGGWHWRTKAFPLVGALLLTFVAGALFSLHRHRFVSQLPVPVELSTAHRGAVLVGTCGRREKDIAYRTRQTPLAVLTGIKSAEDCSQRCFKEGECMVWSWEAVNNHCTLRQLEQDEQPVLKHKSDAVSGGLPCDSPQLGPSPKLFCFMVVEPTGIVPGLLATQHAHGKGIFGCDQHGVYGSRALHIGAGVNSYVLSGKVGTPGGRGIFLAAWRRIVADKKFSAYDWTVKVDAETVFLPRELRMVLKHHFETPTGVYINNCIMGLKGPLEILSRHAVARLVKGLHTCQVHMKKACGNKCSWVEGFFIDWCMGTVLHIRRDNDWRLLNQEKCPADPHQPSAWQNCSSGHVAFHPFRTPSDFEACARKAHATATIHAARDTRTPEQRNPTHVADSGQQSEVSSAARLAKKAESKSKAGDKQEKNEAEEGNDELKLKDEPEDKSTQRGASVPKNRDNRTEESNLTTDNEHEVNVKPNWSTRVNASGRPKVHKRPKAVVRPKLDGESTNDTKPGYGVEPDTAHSGDNTGFTTSDMVKGICGLIEKDVDYDSEGKAAFTLDHIPSPDMCCAMCHGIPECTAWIWKEDSKLDGCRYRCWVKTDGKPAPADKVSHKGVVSGLPPARPKLESRVSQSIHASGDATPQPIRLFCFALSMPVGYEPHFLKMQHSLRTGIFACDGYEVYSNKTMKVASGIETKIVQSDLTCGRGGDSYTALNSWIFIAVWRRVIDDGTYKDYDWTVKVDPDAVFFADRLRSVLADHRSAGYVGNCGYGMHGPIEVLSRRAVLTLAKDYAASDDKAKPERCVKELRFGLWGEDMFLDQCLTKVHKVSSVVDVRLLCEANCNCPDWFWCVNGSQRVSFHPFKRADMYRQCLANSLHPQVLLRH